MLNLSLRQLRAFNAVARHLSFARASEELHLTQPAVSMQIRELERALGFVVFDRAGRSLRLSAGGEYLLVYARRILGSLKEAEDTFARLRGLKSGRVSVGMVSTAQYFLPGMLARFRDEREGIDLNLRVGNREQLLKMLHEKEVDLAVMGRPPRELETRAEAFAPNPLGVIASGGHALSRRKVEPLDLDRQAFIIRETGSGTRAAMESFFREHRISPPTIMEMNNNETIKQAVIANMGLTLISLHTVHMERRAGQIAVLDVAGLPLLRAWHLVGLSGSGLSPAAEAFRVFVMERGEKFLEELFGQQAAPKQAREPMPAAPKKIAKKRLVQAGLSKIRGKS